MEATKTTITRERIKIVITLYYNGIPTSTIMEMTALGSSTIQKITRASRYLKKGDYHTALVALRNGNPNKFTHKKYDIISWICESVGAELPSYELMNEEWKRIFGEDDDDIENCFVEDLSELVDSKTDLRLKLADIVKALNEIIEKINANNY